MKKLLVALFATALSTLAPAQVQTKPAPSRPDVASAVVALAAATVILPAAIITGKRDVLCAAMGGTYFPNSDGFDQCPDGQWSALVGFKEPKDGSGK